MTDTKTTETEELSPSALDVLESNMLLYHRRVPRILEKMIQNAREKGSPSEAIKLAQQLKDCFAISSENAAKLAPYRHAKLESIEVKSDVEHHFVMRAPAPVKNFQEWCALTGAEELKVEKEVAKLEKPKVQSYTWDGSGAVSVEDDPDASSYYHSLKYNSQKH